MAAIFGETNFFANWDSYSAEIHCGSKMSSKLLYLARFSRYKYFYVFAIFVKNSKIQNGRHFRRDKTFQDWDSYSAEIPCESKIFRNRSIQHGFRDITIFMFCNFCEKFENSKWPPFLAR